MPEHYDVIVAGVGSMGSAACHYLTKRGVRVLGIDQAGVPNAKSSHHARTRMVRQAYDKHPDYMPLLLRAHELWEEFSDRSVPCYHKTGGLYIGGPKGVVVPGSKKAAEANGLEYEILKNAELQERFPQFTLEKSHVGFYEERAGFLSPELVVDAHVYATQVDEIGKVLQNEPIIEWKSKRTGVEVTTTKDTYLADHLILTSGSWTDQVAQELGFKLHVTRQVLAWFKLAVDPEPFLIGTFPSWFIEDDKPYGHYGFPYRSLDPGLKIGFNKPGETIDPSTLNDDDKKPTEEETEELRAVMDKYFPGVAGGLGDARVCLYTSSPDGNFVVGKHPKHKNVSLACGFSGHGFKFTSVIGEILADLSTKGKTSHKIDFLSPKRFAKKK